MALRMLVYVGLLYQELVRAGELLAGKRLPPVLPLVLYNGGTPWGAAETLADLIHTPAGGLGRYRPELRYLLIDEGRLGEDELPADENLAAALVRLERAQAPPELARLLKGLAAWLHAPEQAGLRRAFIAWLKRVLLPRRLPEVALPEVHDLGACRIMDESTAEVGERSKYPRFFVT